MSLDQLGEKCTEIGEIIIERMKEQEFEITEQRIRDFVGVYNFEDEIIEATCSVAGIEING